MHMSYCISACRLYKESAYECMWSLNKKHFIVAATTQLIIPLLCPISGHSPYNSCIHMACSIARIFLNAFTTNTGGNGTELINIYYY